MNQGEDRSTIDLTSPDIRGRPTGDYNDDDGDDDDKDDVDDDDSPGAHSHHITNSHLIVFFLQ